MDDSKLIAIVSRLETITKQLSKDTDNLRDWKDGVLQTLQRCQDYMESRKDLPARISVLESAAADWANERNTLGEYYKRVDFLMSWYWRVAGVVIALGIVNTMLIMWGRVVDYYYVVKP